MSACRADRESYGLVAVVVGTSESSLHALLGFDFGP